MQIGLICFCILKLCVQASILQKFWVFLVNSEFGAYPPNDHGLVYSHRSRNVSTTF